MDWKDLAGKFIEFGAPTIGAALGGPLGGTIGGVLGKIAADALGVQATPDAVNTAITTGNAATVQAQLSSADLKAQSELDRFKAALADTQNARAFELEAVKAGSPIAWGPVLISSLITFGFIGCVFTLMLAKINFTDTSGQAFLILTGVLSQAFAQVVGYWLGSSAGSSDKSAQIAALATAALKKK